VSLVCCAVSTLVQGLRYALEAEGVAVSWSIDDDGVELRYDVPSGRMRHRLRAQRASAVFSGFCWALRMLAVDEPTRVRFEEVERLTA
jgi:uncharacterized protein YsxB (DUF464 family)